MKSCLAAIVHATEWDWKHGSYAANIDNTTVSRSDEQRDELFHHDHHGKEVGLEHPAGFIHVQIRSSVRIRFVIYIMSCLMWPNEAEFTHQLRCRTKESGSNIRGRIRDGMYIRIVDQHVQRTARQFRYLSSHRRNFLRLCNVKSNRLDPSRLQRTHRSYIARSSEDTPSCVENPSLSKDVLWSFECEH